MTYSESQLIDNGTGTYLGGILSILSSSAFSIKVFFRLRWLSVEQMLQAMRSVVL